MAFGTATAAFPLLLLAMRRDRSGTLSALLRLENELHVARLVSAELTTIATILVRMRLRVRARRSRPALARFPLAAHTANPLLRHVRYESIDRPQARILQRFRHAHIGTTEAAAAIDDDVEALLEGTQAALELLIEARRAVGVVAATGEILFMLLEGAIVGGSGSCLVRITSCSPAFRVIIVASRLYLLIVFISRLLLLFLVLLLTLSSVTARLLLLTGLFNVDINRLTLGNILTT